MPRILTRLGTTAGLAVLCVAGAVVPAYGRGYTTSPTSRAVFCAQGTATDCGQIQWEPQSVEGPKGFPAAGPADGTICSAGLAQFAELDDPRGGTWPANQVQAGSHTFSWTFTAAHATTSFEYYITKQGWDPTQPLTRADLEPQPFLSVPYDGQRPPSQLSHTGTLPSRSGRHLVLAVWTIADTTNAFYQCSDLDFG
jgi:predicted carbohydrate-binding protein with CBM5 and CBM33 domain